MIQTYKFIGNAMSREPYGSCVTRIKIRYIKRMNLL